jgi:hypothetical protein
MAIGALEWNGAEMRALRETLLPAPRSGRATPLGLPWVNSRGWPSGKRTRWSAPSSLDWWYRTGKTSGTSAWTRPYCAGSRR